jgi:D-serine deaminase-like pyridoxal phosphate-dependent protein
VHCEESRKDGYEDRSKDGSEEGSKDADEDASEDGSIVDALDLDTPALYVDLDVLEHNIAGMQQQCRAWGVELRPHVKTHKIPEIARMQLDAGAIGITVAKVGEAEMLPGDDVLVAYPLVKAKLPRLREVAKTRRVKVAVDSVEVARDLKGIETLVEIDVGVGRTGAQSPEQAVEIAKACSDFRGIFYWPSWLDESGFRAASVKVDAVLDALSTAGFESKIVSGGSTPGAAKTPLIPRTTEIRPGTYVFYDANSIEAKACVEADCALRVLTTVVSTSVPGQCVIDAGSKTFSSDQTVGSGTFGLVVGRQWTVRKLNEEHGYVEIHSPARVGEKVWVIPSHVCPTVNLHDEVWYGRRGRVEGSWKVAARGKVR